MLEILASPPKSHERKVMRVHVVAQHVAATELVSMARLGAIGAQIDPRAYDVARESSACE